MTVYEVSAEWTGKWWVLQADAAPGAITQVKRLSHANEIIEAIAFVTDEPEDDISIDVRPVLPDAAAEQLAEAQQARELSRHYNSISAEKSYAAVAHLRERGLTVDDIGTMLHISKQRVSQLLNRRTLPTTPHEDVA